jgi:hypothetical protein
MNTVQVGMRIEAEILKSVRRSNAYPGEKKPY